MKFTRYCRFAVKKDCTVQKPLKMCISFVFSWSICPWNSRCRPSRRPFACARAFSCQTEKCTAWQASRCCQKALRSMRPGSPQARRALGSTGCGLLPCALSSRPARSDLSLMGSLFLWERTYGKVGFASLLTHKPTFHKKYAEGVRCPVVTGVTATD